MNVNARGLLAPGYLSTLKHNTPWTGGIAYRWHSRFCFNPSGAHWHGSMAWRNRARVCLLLRTKIREMLEIVPKSQL